MALLIWLVLFVVIVGFVLLLPALWRRSILNRFSGSRLVTCPENQHSAVVGIDAQYAAETEMDGRADVRLCECSRWPDRSECGQECLQQAIATEPYPRGEVKGRKKQIYHLPIWVAAFSGWVLGAIWHSQHIFRTRWMEAVGLSRADVKQMVWWVSPHLLTAAMCLLFAYGVASLLSVYHRKWVLAGVLASVVLCVALMAASAYAISGLPRDLVAIEAGYIVVAALMIGAIVGGLFDKMVLPVK